MAYSATERRSFEAAVQKWQRRFGLDDFLIAVRHGPLDKSTTAESHGNSRYKRTMIVLNTRVNVAADDEISETDLNRTAAHEIVHSATRELFEVGLDNLERHLGGGTLFQAASNELTEANERLCDRLAIGAVRWEREVSKGKKISKRRGLARKQEAARREDRRKKVR